MLLRCSRAGWCSNASINRTPPQLINEGHVALRRLQRPGEGTGVARPASALLPAQTGPEPLPLAVAALQQPPLHGKAESTAGITDPEPIERLQIHRGERRHFAEKDIAALLGTRARQLAQQGAGQPVRLLELPLHQLLLQRGVIEAGGTAERQPAAGMTGQEVLSLTSSSSRQQHLDQQTGCPVITGGIQPIELVGDQVHQLVTALLDLAQQTAALALRAGEKAFEQLIGAGGAGDRRTGKHGERTAEGTCGRGRRLEPTMSGRSKAWARQRRIKGPAPARSGSEALPRIPFSPKVMAAAIQFFRGVDEPVVPDIRLTRSRDGRTGQALFVFEEPVALAPETMGDITGMFLVDEEGELVTREVKARFVNGKPFALEATFTWKTTADFERFMRFAQRYADSHELGFSGQDDDKAPEAGEADA